MFVIKQESRAPLTSIVAQHNTMEVSSAHKRLIPLCLAKQINVYMFELFSKEVPEFALKKKLKPANSLPMTVVSNMVPAWSLSCPPQHILLIASFFIFSYYIFFY